VIEDSLIKEDFDDNGLSPYEISVKYEIDVKEVYKILESKDNKESF